MILRNVLLGFVQREMLTPEQAKAMCDDASLVLRRPQSSA